MSEWILLERLPGNDLQLPKYETELSAGMDFAACLKRPCFSVHDGGYKQPFVINQWSAREEISKESAKEWTNDQVLEYGDKPPEISIMANETVMIPLGYRCEFGLNYVLHLHIRSSISMLGLALANGTGIIDSDYRGDLFALIWNRRNNIIDIKHGDRIVQGELVKFDQAIIQEGKVNETVRGENGFGSTGLR